ncbi:MAG: RNA polymerase sigma factor [Patescibacteria group bacterium]|nr:RNA polymerase sigma factor [Patescibacteria group bacterium]
MKGNLLKNQYLLFKAKNKDPEAFSKVYDLYLDRIYRFIFFKVANAEDAQDLSSEVFLKTWQYIADGKKVKNLNAFFYKTARNLIVDYYRRASKGTEISLEKEKDNLDERMGAATSSLEKIDVGLDIEDLETKLRELKDEYREVIVLRYIENLSIGEIAEIIEKKKGNVRVLLYRALNTLKELVAKEPKK